MRKDKFSAQRYLSVKNATLISCKLITNQQLTIMPQWTTQSVGKGPFQLSNELNKCLYSPSLKQQNEKNTNG